MNEKKKYYWLKLQSDFFDQPATKILEGMPGGKEFELFYLKLLCKSVSQNGKLQLSDEIPYSPEMLSAITDTPITTVKSAIIALEKLNLIEILDGETLYMTGIERMIGSMANTPEANRVRKFRERKKEERIEAAEHPEALPETPPPETENNGENDDSADNADNLRSNVTKCNAPVTSDVTPELQNVTRDRVRDRDRVKRENKKRENDLLSQVIAYLNGMCGTHYREQSQKTRSLVHARAAEGYTLDDFKDVIRKKYDEWNGTDMEKFLRPETLFGTKFESYLNQKDRRRGRPPDSKIPGNYDELEKKLLGG